MRLVAQLGGFIATRGDPGTQTIWRGLQRLDDTTVMYRKLVEQLLRKARITIASSGLVGNSQTPEEVMAEEYQELGKTAALDS